MGSLNEFSVHAQCTHQLPFLFVVFISEAEVTPPRRRCWKPQQFPSSAAFGFLGSPTETPTATVPDDSNLFELLHRWQSKQFNVTFIHHCRRYSNSKNHRSTHPLHIKWLHRTELSTPHLLPPPFAILHGSPIGTTSTAKPPRLILTAEPSMLIASASIRCWLAPLRP
jgi:hypothetical protein